MNENQNDDKKLWDALVKKFPGLAEKRGWNDIDEHEEWAVILAENPELADKSNLRLSQDGWSWLLSKQPQFVDKCPFVKDLSDESLA